MKQGRTPSFSSEVQMTPRNTQRENTQQRSGSAHTYTHPTQLTLLVHRLQPTPPLTGQDDQPRTALCTPGSKS